MCMPLYDAVYCTFIEVNMKWDVVTRVYFPTYSTDWEGRFVYAWRQIPHARLAFDIDRLDVIQR